MKNTAWSRAFEKSCREWQGAFGLTDWTISFAIERGGDGVEADVQYNWDDRHAVLTAHVKTKHPLAPERVGLHEMLHLLFADLLKVASQRANDLHPDVLREEHKVIERLLNVMDGKP